MAQDKINGAALRAIRTRSDLSIVELVAEIAKHGVTVTADHISNIEADRRGASPALITAAARALKIPRLALLRERADDEQTAGVA